jgi:hypothetical protein
MRCFPGSAASDGMIDRKKEKMNTTNKFLVAMLVCTVVLCGCQRSSDEDTGTAATPPPSDESQPTAGAPKSATEVPSESDFRCPGESYMASCLHYQLMKTRAQKVIINSANLVCFRQGVDYLDWFFVVAYVPPEHGDHGAPSLMTTEVFSDGEPSPSLPPSLSLLGGHVEVAGYHADQRFPNGKKQTAIVDDDRVVLTDSYKRADQRKMYYILTLKRAAGTFTETFFDVSSLPQQVVGTEKGSCVQVKPFDFSERP